MNPFLRTETTGDDMRNPFTFVKQAKPIPQVRDRERDWAALDFSERAMILAALREIDVKLTPRAQTYLRRHCGVPR